MTTSTEELRDELFAGKPLKENVQDIVARNNTGYSYAELQSEECAEIGELDYQEELGEIDKTVNLLLHLYIAHITQQTLEARIDEVESAIRVYTNTPPSSVKGVVKDLKYRLEKLESESAQLKKGQE